MFTGIVQGTAELVAIDELPNFRTHVIRMPSPAWGEGLALGASVAHNGCCLTVTRVEGELVSFDLMQETLRLTNLGQLQPGDKVNVERAARFGDEIGGHAMSGHIMGTAQVVSVIDTPNNRQVWYRLAPTLMKYVLTKGYIGIDGISLTVGEVRGNEFCVNLIPETLARTNLGWVKAGWHTNIEIDPRPRPSSTRWSGYWRPVSRGKLTNAPSGICHTKWPASCRPLAIWWVGSLAVRTSVHRLRPQTVAGSRAPHPDAVAGGWGCSRPCNPRRTPDPPGWHPARPGYDGHSGGRRCACWCTRS